MGNAFSMLKGLGLGAGLMYLFDPDRGRRRQALLLDQLDHARHGLEDFLGKATRDLGNRAYGTVAELGSRFEGDVDDRVLVDRVRSKLGRVTTHPRAIEVAARQGVVTLRGPILAHEADDVLSAIGRVGGVAGVEDHLERHEHAGNIPALQGEARPAGERWEVCQENWSPAAKLAVGMAGGVLALRLARSGRVVGLGLAALGAGLLAKGIIETTGRGADGSRRRPEAEDTHAGWVGFESPPLPAPRMNSVPVGP